jgi:hypothetical protein
MSDPEIQMYSAEIWHERTCMKMFKRRDCAIGDGNWLRGSKVRAQKKLVQGKPEADSAGRCCMKKLSF